MPTIQWLATLGLALLLPAAHATTAVVFSESTGRYGVAWNESGKEVAIQKATEDCRYRGGGKDCKPVKVTDTPGYGTVAQTCAGGFCGISIITGRRSEAEAERDAVRDCNTQYGTSDCRAYDRWQETAAAPVAKAPPSPIQQQKPATPTMKPVLPTPSAANEKAQLYEEGCSLGVAAGCANLGFLYLKGDGVRQDKQKAAQLFDKACGNRDARSCGALGAMYHAGDGITQDTQKTVQLFDKACGLELSAGCSNLGVMYAKGDGVRQDMQKAVQLFDKACGMDHGHSCFNLGLRYFEGEGIRQDKQKAAQLYDKACGLKYGAGCTFLGEMYFKGGGVRLDRQNAVHLYDKACSLGEAKSCEVAKILRGER
ncbi:MAG: SEL1-like repeat protein [Gammaproteobacteria bacterium]|nr:SEL1-like repeat protein [Gammaproteobacteria bacterium]MBU3988147.1 SEL1-like repeat protein [Gammaproteobacteria bacterium]MBU4006361.1 SEL1-like repeat protein [Gammaproteobacteria bacterium]MBU4097968.1 SEL1-like repeat protein [Gammaproteobacteria bacterium]MBU4148674.1 SEL1-like repeat protein [Gammaproteobacteria bacterium]